MRTIRRVRVRNADELPGRRHRLAPHGCLRCAGSQNPITSCLAYANETVPKDPTSADCAAVSLSLIPYDIPAPAACCGEGALPVDIVDTCMLDCGYASCKTAIAAIRTSADALATDNPLLKDAYAISKADLHAFADLLDAPSSLQYCANKISANPGQVVSLDLGSGVSKSTEFGHIKTANLFVGCGLDANTPYVIDPGVDECTEPTNIPAAMAEQESSGIINGGAITVRDRGVSTVAAITNARISTREVLNRDMSIDFTLTAFDATVLGAASGSFEFRAAQVKLAAPASGILEAQTVTFAPGTLRFAVTADVLVNGEPLFGRLPMTAEYGNSVTATAFRGVDGAFHLSTLRSRSASSPSFSTRSRAFYGRFSRCIDTRPRGREVLMSSR